MMISMSERPSKVVLFGSFNEDESLPWQTKTRPTVREEQPEQKQPSQLKSPEPVKPPIVREKPKENKPSQVEPVPVLTFGSFGSLAVVSNPSHIHKDTKELASSHLPETVTRNRQVHISNSLGDGIHEGIDFPPLHSSYNGSAPARNSSSQLVYSDGSKSPADQTRNKEASLNKDVDPVIAERGLLRRGLVNKGNLCFLNATLQALMACSPFVQLLQGLRSRNLSKVGYPTLASFAEFIGEFDVPKGANMNKDLESGRPFSPVMFEAVLKKFTPDVPSSITRRPRQEDAQEFLGFVMDQMHDELLKLRGESDSDGKNSSVVSVYEDDEWETVGSKNKSAVTRTLDFVPSELSTIFGGKLRSVVKSSGNKASATVEPFLLLHLDVSHDDIRTLVDALHLFAAPETLDEYRTSTTKKTGVVSATKSVNIQSLPKIMILHLMRFGYGNHGSTKVHKPVHFPLGMTLNRDLLVSGTAESRKYELVSTVTHHGKEASKGHYTADVRHENGQWLRYDDASVNAISTKRVLHDQAYILFYKQV